MAGFGMSDFLVKNFGYEPTYFEVKKNGASQFETMIAYLGGSMFQTVGDNPITAYRQLVQQYAKGADGKMVDPKIASQEAKNVFKKSPVSACLSGLVPRIIGVMFKRVPKFGILLGLSYVLEKDGQVGMAAATGASILSAPFINPIRMIEKQQRAEFKTTGVQKPVREILKESSTQMFRPLFRGTIPLMGHSFASAALGLVGQPKLKKWVQKQLGSTGMPATRSRSSPRARPRCAWKPARTLELTVKSRSRRRRCCRCCCSRRCRSSRSSRSRSSHRRCSSSLHRCCRPS